MGPDALADRLGQRHTEVLLARGDVSLEVPAEELLDTLSYLRGDPDLAFDMFSDLAATDWPDRDPRFWLAYHLASVEHHHRVRVRVGLPGDEPRAPTVTALYPAANWFEREVYDFFGVVFDGHPDLTRIELPDDWTTFPLRKTEPLAGVRTQYIGAFVPPPDERGL